VNGGETVLRAWNLIFLANVLSFGRLGLGCLFYMEFMVFISTPRTIHWIMEYGSYIGLSRGFVE